MKQLTQKIYEGSALSLEELEFLISKTIEAFSNEQMLLKVSSPTVVIGDIHGQFPDLRDKILTRTDWTNQGPSENLLFLGDYVDRGSYSVECITLLFCLKCMYPNSVFLLRGNHECETITKIYGFYDECVNKYSDYVWKMFISAFNMMPCAAIIDEKIFCCHGGIPMIESLDEINEIKRPCPIPERGLLCDIVWADPDEDIKYYGESDRGISYTFGEKAINDFLKRFDFNVVCRAHQFTEYGYNFNFGRKVVTVFSAPDYCGEKNKASIMKVDENLMCSFEVYE